MSKLPQNLLEAVRYFSDLDVCVEFVAKLRWAAGPVCERCGGIEHSYLKTRRLWKCKSCKRQFSVKVGTIFEDSALGLDKWLPAIWLIANSKNGISSHELARALGVTQKSAWFMLHRIRLAMQTGSFDKFTGEVEVDETFIGGRARNMHAKVRKAKEISHSNLHKTLAFGALERNDDGPSQVSVAVIDDRSRETLRAEIDARVETGSAIYSDEWRGYTGLESDYAHKTVNHAVEYVVGQVTTNGIENFWSLLKRGLHGTYVSVEPFHLFRYLDERVFTFNTRDLTDLGRFSVALSQISGRRLTYAALTGQE